MPTTDKTVSNPIINILTKEQYNSITNPSEDEIYLLTNDSNFITDVQVNGTSAVSLDHVANITMPIISAGQSGAGHADLVSVTLAAPNITRSLVSVGDNGKIGSWRLPDGVGTITGIKMNGASKGTSGVVDLGTVITSHQDVSGKLDKTGGTMTGQLKTSYRESVAMGSYGTAQTTVDGLVNEVRFSSGAMGSASINTAYTKNGVTIPTGWYNFIFSPHRSGGVNGSASGDNCNYGTLILAPMTFTGDTFIIRCSTSGAASVRRLGFTNKATYDGNGSGVTGFWNSAITTHQDGWLEREGNVVYCYMRFSAPATVTSGQQIATIPVGYRPSHICHYTATRAWAIQATAPVSVSNTTGAVAFINTAFAASANYVLCATWLTNDAFPA